MSDEVNILESVSVIIRLVQSVTPSLHVRILLLLLLFLLFICVFGRCWGVGGGGNL